MKPVLKDFHYDPKKGFTIIHQQDDMPIIEQNQAERMMKANGFTGKRLMRKVASIPVLAVIQAERDGYNMDDPADVKRYLLKHPEYMTVRAFDTRRDPRVRVSGE